MTTLCKPSVVVPEHIITREETLELARRMHAGHPQLELVLRLISNTGVQKRHLIRPIEQTLTHPGWAERTRLYEEHAKARLPGAIEQALANAEANAADIDAILYVSCTGFTMPALTAWMINPLGFRSDTSQIPMAQLGCAAGGSAINRALDFCIAHPGTNALIVACEFCSLCYQPDDVGIGELLSTGLFGDAVAAAVVRGDDRVGGVHLELSGSALVPNSEPWISYEIKDTGFHFRLDKRVPQSAKYLAPALRDTSTRHGWDASCLDFYVVHAGGPRVLDGVAAHLEIAPAALRHSRATLTEHGNIASTGIFDSLSKHFDEGNDSGARGIIAAFGPGITAEVTLGTWTGPGRPDSSHSADGAEGDLW